MDSSVTPVDNRPRLIRSDVNYTQIVVDRTQALDGTFYDVMFVGTGGSRPPVRTLAEPAHLCCWGPAPPTVPRCFMGESLILASEVCHHASPGPRLGLQAQYMEARTKGVRVVPMRAG